MELLTPEQQEELERDHNSALYIAGALEAYFQYMGVGRAADDEESVLRERIKPMVDELRAIRHRAAGLPQRPKKVPRG